ncbi:hypothetical protein EDD21DRAFT_386905 [Dissophora ornata]|nr:hypothetical protein EDD21DRAFT_386905 [Dissophora ornata]
MQHHVDTEETRPVVTPAHLLPPSDIQTDLCFPRSIDPLKIEYFRTHSVSEWFPERCLANGYTMVDTFFEGMSSIIKLRNWNPQVHDFCKGIYKYYRETDEGQDQLELLGFARRKSRRRVMFRSACEGSLLRAGAKRALSVDFLDWRRAPRRKLRSARTATASSLGLTSTRQDAKTPPAPSPFIAAEQCGTSMGDDARRLRTPSATDSEPDRDFDLSLLTARGRELGDVLNASTFVFEATVGSENLGFYFTAYYNRYRITKGFDPKLATDVIALAGVLCLVNETEVQLELLRPLLPRVKKEVQVPFKDVKKERSVVRSWWEAWHDQYEENQLQAEVTSESQDAEDVDDKETPRKAARRSVSSSNAKGLLLESLANMHQTLFASLQTDPISHFSEVDGMASFLCPFMTPLLQKPDVLRFSCNNRHSNAICTRPLVLLYQELTVSKYILAR